MQIIHLPSRATGLVRPIPSISATEAIGSRPFIESNTQEATLQEIRSEHAVPVYSRCNTPLISHSDFIEVAQEVLEQMFAAERIESPAIRLSHIQRNRIPEAKHKPVSELQSWEETRYFQRMAFCITVPSISDQVAGERLCVMIAGIKDYSRDNMNGRSGSEQHFKLAIGHSVAVCSNGCISSDHYVGDLRVRDLDQLRAAIQTQIGSFDHVRQLRFLNSLTERTLTEDQFTYFVGRCRMYQNLPLREKRGIPELLFGDSMINTVVRGYYEDPNFGRQEDGNISLWRVYNLLTEAAKSSYIDGFLDRTCNATALMRQLQIGLERGDSWFLP